jgi:hypothetical protein
MSTNELPIFANPANLNYFFLTDYNSELKIEVIKQLFLRSKFGEMRLAIIGASHLFEINGRFAELLTCSPPDLRNVTKKHEFRKSHIFSHETIISSIRYTIKVQFEPFRDSIAFSESELEVRNQKPNLLHNFEPDSAITALSYNIDNEKFILKTWHTYPDFLTIVYSETKLTLL